MDVLQQSMNRAVEQLPALFIERLVSKKLREQGIKPSKRLSERIAKYVLSDKSEPFRYKGHKHSGDITLTVSEGDADEVVRALENFCETQLPKIIPEVSNRLAKTVLADLKSRWTKEYTLQSADLSEFRKRLEGRWGKPLGKLRMLLTMAREWCQEAHDRETSKGKQNKTLRRILIQMLVRACQVTDEIICLLENGFADGAMARWRTLHEIGVVAAVLSLHGDSIAERYLAHQAIESKRAMDKYLACYESLGYKPLSAREQAKIVKTYDQAVARYGKPFKSDYGWAASHLNNDRPTFADLEAAAGRAEMRAHYQMGNDNVHAGIKSMFVRLGLLDDYTGLLAGRSNAGLTDPGQNAAHTLTQLSVLVCLSEPTVDDLVVAEMMRMLRDEIPRSFWRADSRLRRDDKQCKIAVDRRRLIRV
jgi:hypothetical protein